MLSPGFFLPRQYKATTVCGFALRDRDPSAAFFTNLNNTGQDLVARRDCRRDPAGTSKLTRFSPPHSPLSTGRIDVALV